MAIFAIMNKRLVPAYLLTFVNVLGFSILMPVLPFVVESYGAPKWVYGLLLTLYSAFQFLGAPYLGAMSDRIGRKPVLLISQAGTLLSWFVFLLALVVPNTGFLGFALPLWIIAASRILDGITGGNTSVANAYVSDITTREEKSYIFGYLGGIAGIGMIIGPGIGGLTASSGIGYAGTLIAAIVISTITLVVIFTWLKESHAEDKRSTEKRQNMLYSILILRRIKRVNPSRLIRIIFVMKLLFSIMMAFYISTIALFMIDRFQFNERELGFFMLGVGVFLSFNQAFMSKRFIKRFGEFKTLVIGLILCFVGMISITFPTNMVLYFACYYLLNLGLSLCFPTFNALISVHANQSKLGEIMGISESINSLAMALFPVIAAGLYGVFGYHIYYVVVVLPLIALILGVLWLNGKRKQMAADEVVLEGRVV